MKLTAAVVALALSGVLATVAHADPVNINNDPTKILADRGQLSAAQTQHKSFEWDAAKSRWGLKFDVEQQPGLSSEWKNVQAGAYFKVTPSLRVGAGVSLGDAQTNNTGNALAQTPAPPRVHWKPPSSSRTSGP
ncbi:MAG: NtrZ family periplasmic regulatory protein [Caulobacteraceae bacterium]